jgi:hypothetical protein
MSTHEQEQIERLQKQATHAANERRQLLAVLAQVRAALATPDGVDITHHARQVMEERAAMAQDLAHAQADAAPMQPITEILMAWELRLNADDAMLELRDWWIKQVKAVQA